MTVRRIGLLFFALLALPLVAQAQNQVPDCVTVTHSARWGAAGYDHRVRVANGCEHPVRCTVATNVNPDPSTIRVEPGQSEEVLTWRDSPAREFTPRVSCEEL